MTSDIIFESYDILQRLPITFKNKSIEGGNYPILCVVFSYDFGHSETSNATFLKTKIAIQRLFDVLNTYICVVT